MAILTGSIVAIDTSIKMAEMAIEMWIWPICLDLEVGHLLNFGGMTYPASEERIYPLGRDPVDDPEERIEVEILHVDAGTGTMTAAGAAVENENVGTGVQIELEATKGAALMAMMIETFLDALVDRLGAEAEELVDASPVTMIYEMRGDGIEITPVIILLLPCLHLRPLWSRDFPKRFPRMTCIKHWLIGDH